jgi:hypothetical protein
MKIHGFPVSLVVFSDDCGGSGGSVPGHVEPGESVPCPHGDHEHLVEMAVHAHVATNVTITSAD